MKHVRSFVDNAVFGAAFAVGFLFVTLVAAHFHLLHL